MMLYQMFSLLTVLLPLSLSLAQANKDSPLETHLYVASYAEQAKAEHVHR